MKLRGVGTQIIFGGPALVYGAAVRARVWAYERGFLETVRIPVPVFCVGNLTLGGTGKTPTALWLVDELKRRGHRPAVVSRGYGRQDKTPVILVPAGENPLPPASTIGDEPRLIARRAGVPVAVGADRALACERVWGEFKPDCLVLDDGFQHFRIYRDRDVVCVDAPTAHRVFVGGKSAPLLPAGPWRESPAGLARAHLVLLTRTDGFPPERLAAVRERLSGLGRPVVPVAASFSLRELATDRPFPTDGLRGVPVLALSALGDPDSFESALARAGAHVAGLRYRDHHFFTRPEQTGALERARRENRRIVVTEKDRERLPDDFPALVTRLEYRVAEENLWGSVIESAFA